MSVNYVVWYYNRQAARRRQMSESLLADPEDAATFKLFVGENEALLIRRDTGRQRG